MATREDSMNEELRYWYLGCKVCGNLHREAQPADLKAGLNVKVAGKVECSDFPGKFADYGSEHWLLLTDSEKREFLERNRQEHQNGVVRQADIKQKGRPISESPE